MRNNTKSTLLLRVHDAAATGHAAPAQPLLESLTLAAYRAEVMVSNLVFGSLRRWWTWVCCLAHTAATLTALKTIFCRFIQPGVSGRPADATQREQKYGK